MDITWRFLVRRAPALVRVVSCAVSMSLLFTACTTTRAVTGSERQRIAQWVRPGDRVKCTLQDGSQREFEVVKLEPGVLVGAKQQAAVNDIARIEVRRLSTGKTALMVVCLLALGAAGVSLADFAVFPTVVP